MPSSRPAIPFNWPAPIGRELEYMADAAQRGHLSGDGHYTRVASEMLSSEHNGAKVLLTTSCTHALEMAALLLDIKPGDEVIVPSFTFVSAVNAFVLRGARPVFADIRADTLNIDETKLRGLITPNTRAVVPVHYAGVACEMDEISAICDEHNIAIVEDNAHGIFGKYKGRPLGTIGQLSTLSFHETKNFTAGEGGALVINDPEFAARAEILREKGTNRSAYFRGQVDKYTWVDMGSSYLPSELLAAWLWAQLQEREAITARRSEIWNRYKSGLANWAARNNCAMPVVPAGVEPTHHIFHVVLPSLQFRTALLDFLRGQGIGAVFHYQALNVSPMGRKFGGTTGECPVAERVSDCLIRLPLFNTLDLADVDKVIGAIDSFDVQ
ncbi:MAG: dTDP-4-amino-4,6-dideoxygalactose transaminase [Gemmatimonadaceae bacterium]|nr:dTDP-4-amino-4,6-dideoxygalactose transaminase [Gemmatimonadaceae bacterium]